MSTGFLRPLQLLNWIYHSSASRCRNLYYRCLGANIGGYVWMRAIEIPRNWSDVTLEAGVALDQGVVLLCTGPQKDGKLLIRTGTYVNRYTMFDVHFHLEIGRDCLIGPHCYFTDGNHGTEAGHTVRVQAMQTKPVIIEDEVWIGAHVTVLPGVRIGRGAIIGAGSVVTRDVAANTVAVGVPARTLRVRS